MFAYTRRGIVRYIASPWRRQWDEIIIHHTFRPTVKDFERRPNGAYWMKAMDRVHRLKGWGGIGYHFVVMPDGLIYVGRDLNTGGAHTVGHNMTGIGVCILGNFDEEDVPPNAYVSLKYLVSFLIIRFEENMWMKEKAVYFHRQFARKSCPGWRLKLDEVRAAIARTLPDARERYQALLEGEKQ